MKPRLRRKCELRQKQSWKFVRVMPTCILQDNMQGIPCEFVSKFSSESSTFVSLTVPNHPFTWTVKISKMENKLKLCTGWKRFVGDNSINDGYVLVFKYKGNCDFQVQIFDPSGSELRCRSLTAYCNANKQEGASYISVKEEGEKEESDDEQEGEEGEEEESDDKQEGEEGEEEESDDEQEGEYQQDESRMKAETRIQNSQRSSTKHNDIYEEEGSKLESFLLSLKNPFFRTKIRSSRRSELLIPSDLINTFGLKFGSTITLEDPKKQKFAAKVVKWKDGRTWLTQGWKSLCKYNLVSDKNTCICELICNKECTCRVIKVHIFRA